MGGIAIDREKIGPGAARRGATAVAVGPGAARQGAWGARTVRATAAAVGLGPPDEGPGAPAPPWATAAVGPGGGLYALNIRSLCLEYQITMP